MTALLRRAALLLAVGAILFVFSERMFWSFWRPDDDMGSYLGGWLLYAFLGYVLLAACRLSAARGVWALFLAAAAFGWLDEGVVAMTLFGDPSMPFPLTVSWTALAWHASITVLVGLYALRRCLLADRIWPTLALSLGLGVFWGVWAAGWRAETPPVVADPGAFALHVAAATLALALAEAALGPAGLAAFRPSRAGLAIAAVAVAAFLGVVTIPAVPIAPLVLVPLLGVLALALRRIRTRNDRAGGDRAGVPGAGRAPDLLALLGGTPRPRNLAGLAALPAAATATYAALDGVGEGAPVHLAIALVATVLGFGLLATALGRAVAA